jgi:pimeloyl-ACP methyl ester carboxylesterase
VTCNVTSTFIDRPEGRLHVACAGSDGPSIILLSGAGVDNAALSWSHLIPALAPFFQVYALDWPKQGKSRPWNGLADHSALLSSIDAVFDHFKLERAALVGLSQGGAMSIAYTQERPERVWAMVAAGPAGTIDFPPGLHQLLYLVAKLPGPVNWATRALLGNHRNAAAFARSALFAGPVADFDRIVDDIVEEVREGGGGASDWQNGSIGPFRMNVDLRPGLGEITCPALFIQGDKDAGVKPEHTRAAAEAVPGAEFVLMESTGHWTSRQDPEAFNAIVLAFLDRHRPDQT